jgi:hypothetical protein
MVMKTRDNEAKVQYMDNGNSEQVQMSRMKQVKPDFMDLPIQAMKCGLYGVELPS